MELSDSSESDEREGKDGMELLKREYPPYWVLERLMKKWGMRMEIVKREKGEVGLRINGETCERAERAKEGVRDELALKYLEVRWRLTSATSLI